MLYGIDGSPAFRLELYNNSVAHKWKHIIKSIYAGDGEDFDNRRTFYQYRTSNQMKQDLIVAIKNINTFLKHEFIQVPTNFDQDFLNELHIKFERLAGEFDNPTKLMILATIEIKESVRDLNFCVHSLENVNDANNTITIQWTKLRESTPRVPLEKSEYQYMQFDRKMNEVYLHYNELGKNYIDIWKDNLDPNYTNLKNNHFIGADILISFDNKESIFEKEFLSWCEKNKIDAFDKNNGIGNLPIGKIEWLNRVQLTKDSKIDIIEGVI